MGKGTKFAAIGGIIAVVASITGILSFVYPIVETEVFPEKDRYEVTVFLKDYDFLTDEVKSVQNFELITAYDIDSIVQGIENQIVLKIKPQEEERIVNLKIAGNILVSSIPLDTTTYVYREDENSLSVIQAAPNLPHPDEPIMENTGEMQFDLTVISQEPFIDPKTNCVIMSVKPSGSYNKENIEICKNSLSQFTINGENNQEFTFSPTAKNTIIVEPFKIEGEENENFPASSLKSKIETKLREYQFLDIEQSSLEELKEKREQVTALSPSGGKLEIAEAYDVDFILTGSVLVKKEK